MTFPKHHGSVNQTPELMRHCALASQLFLYFGSVSERSVIMEQRDIMV